MTRPAARRTLAVGVALAALVAAPTSAVHADPPAGVTTVVVTLREALDPTPPPGTRQADRPGAVAAVLRARARVAQASLTARLAALARSGEVLRYEALWTTDAVSVTGSANAVAELARRADVAAVTPDEIVLTPTAVEENVARIGAPTLWDGGATGAGVVVATLDSGVDLSHPDVAARWRGGTNSWFDPYGQHPSSPVDLTGHGTAVTSLVVGGDTTSSYGVAPGATWIAARVFDDRGAASLTRMHQVFQWLLDPDGDPGTADAPAVVNGSWALGSGPSCTLSLRSDVQALTAAGIVPVFAAGNFGPGSGTSVSPANYPESLSVGAVGAGDVVWAYSGSGPSTCGGRTRVYPDVVAPGVDIRAAGLAGSVQTLTGTSVAAPHVTGALALLAGAHPAATRQSLVDALTGTAVDLGPAGADPRYGAGRVDVVAAEAALAAAPPPPVAADFTVSAPATATVKRGASAGVTLSAAVVAGQPDPVSLTVSGLPSGVAGTWATNPLPVPGSSVLTLTASTKAPRGSYVLVLAASGSGRVRSASVTLTVR